MDEIPSQEGMPQELLLLEFACMGNILADFVKIKRQTEAQKAWFISM